VIHGHNMGNGTMFADIPNYQNEDILWNTATALATTHDNVCLYFFAVASTTDTSGLYLADPTFEELITAQKLREYLQADLHLPRI
ncbi:MAG: hypothetical protein V8Q92_09310, partial [Coprococcus comes]